MFNGLGKTVLCAMAAIILPAQTFTTLHSFDSTDGANPYAGLLQATNGNFYGTAHSGARRGTVFSITPTGALTTLYAFCAKRGCSDGSDPLTGLVQTMNGDLYGTTPDGGGTSVSCSNGCGTVFKIAPAGALTTLHVFCQGDCLDGNGPLVVGADGNLYGTAYYGGGFGLGTVFKITPSGTLTTLYSFCSQGVWPNCPDGESPSAGLVAADDGDLYGTTSLGGARNARCPSGCGTVFKITQSGALTTLHRFTGADGSSGMALAQASTGDFYGTTNFGGLSGANCWGGLCGTVFKITPSGTLTTLHRFIGNDGGNPSAALVQGTDGAFYGTTSAGGLSGTNCFSVGCGTVFKITSTVS